MRLFTRRRDTRARTDAIQATARQMGWSTDGAAALVPSALPLLLMQRPQAAITNAIGGRAGDGRPMWAFDLSYTIPRQHGRDERVDLTCVVTRLRVVLPTIVLEEEHPLLRERLGLPLHELEWEEFNRRWAVASLDARFAHAMVTGELMELLMRWGHGVRYEIRGGLLLLSASLQAPSNLPHVVNHSEAFRTRIPPVVWDLYG